MDKAYQSFLIIAGLTFIILAVYSSSILTGMAGISVWLMAVEAVWTGKVKYEKYYYKFIEIYLTEKCLLYEGVYIGSETCSTCKNNRGSGRNKKGFWIKCSKLSEAIGEK